MISKDKEKADELAKEGAMLDEGFVAQARASTIQPERERRGVRSLRLCSQLSLFGRGISWTRKKREEAKHRTAVISRYRCMRCGRGSEYIRMKGKCTAPKSKRHMGGHDVVRRSER